MGQIEELQRMVDESERIVFFGGAGVSTESQIPDFRSSNGLYQLEYHYPPEQVVSHSFFVRHTEEFYQFYKERMMFLDAKPNAAHKMCIRDSIRGCGCGESYDNGADP